MLPTLRLWQILRAAPISFEFRQLLQVDHREKMSQKWDMAVKVAYSILMGFTFVFLPFAMSFLCLPRTLEIADLTARQYRAGRHDVLAVTPIGDTGLLLGIVHLCFQSIATSFTGLLKIWAMATGGGVLIFLLNGANATSIAQGTFILSLLVGALFLDYMQCVVWAAVIGIFAGLSRDPFKARLYAFTGYIGLQFLLYMALIAMTIFALPKLLVYQPTAELLFLFGAALMIFFAVRETAIGVVWWQIRQRLNDDIPPFKLMIEQR